VLLEQFDPSESLNESIVNLLHNKTEVYVQNSELKEVTQKTDSQ